MRSINKYVLFAGLAFLITLEVLVSFRAFEEIKKSSLARDHSNELIELAKNLLSELRDAETGQRGFLLTGDESYLEPYLKVRYLIPVDLKNLRQLTFNKDASKYLETIDSLSVERLNKMAAVIEFRRKHGKITALPPVTGATGKQIMDTIHTGMTSYIRIQKDAFNENDNDFQMNMRRLFFLIIIISLIMLFFALLFALFVYRDSQSKLKNALYLETKHLFEIQNIANEKLKQANTTLQVSEEKLSVTLNSIGDAVIATDSESKVTFLNPLAEKLTGWTHDEALGRPVEDIFHIINQLTRQPGRIPVNETLANGTVQGLANHTILISRDGSECDIADSCAPIRDSSRQVIGAVLVFRDVTVEYAAHRALRDSSVLIQTIFNTVVDGIITVNADSGIIESANHAALRIFGYSKTEIIGQNFSMLIPDLRHAEHNGYLEYFNPENKACPTDFQREASGQRKDGKTIPLEITVSEMWMGDQRHFTGTLRDITKRREIEAVLEKAHNGLMELTAELKRVALVKSEFLANMSHELRTPLNSIIGFCEVLYDETFGPLNPKQKTYAGNILSSGTHLLQLINQILDMAKVEAGKMTLTLTILPMKQILSDIAMLAENIIHKKKLQIFLEIDNNLPDIEGEELKVKEIIYNLLSNAVKFTPEGGTIGMRAKQTGSVIEIVVRDSGIGIAPENLSKIFEGFYRVNTPYSRITEGTGLGLPLSKKLVELHRGVLTVESEGLNMGTSVRFTLPIVYKKAG